MQELVLYGVFAIVFLYGSRYVLRLGFQALRSPKKILAFGVIAGLAVTLVPSELSAKGFDSLEEVARLPLEAPLMLEELGQIVMEENATSTTSEMLSDDEMAGWYMAERERYYRTWHRVQDCLLSWLDGDSALVSTEFEGYDLDSV